MVVVIKGRVVRARAEPERARAKGDSCEGALGRFELAAIGHRLREFRTKVAGDSVVGGRVDEDVWEAAECDGHSWIPWITDYAIQSRILLSTHVLCGLWLAFRRPR